MSFYIGLIVICVVYFLFVKGFMGVLVLVVVMLFLVELLMVLLLGVFFIGEMFLFFLWFGIILMMFGFLVIFVVFWK